MIHNHLVIQQEMRSLAIFFQSFFFASGFFFSWRSWTCVPWPMTYRRSCTIYRHNPWANWACVARELDGCWTQLPGVNAAGAAICAEVCLSGRHPDTSGGKGSAQAHARTPCSLENFPGRRCGLVTTKTSGESLESHIWGVWRSS